MRPLLVFPLLAIFLAPPAFATQPSIYFVEEYDPTAEYFGELKDTLPGTDRHPELGEQVVDALHAVSEATFIELQYGFDVAPNAELPMWIFTAPIWRDDESPVGSGSVVYSWELFLDAEQFIPADTFRVALMPYLAALPHMELLVRQRTEQVAPLDPVVCRNLAEVLAGWWIGQQPEATLADCDAVVYWRCEATSEPWNPGPYVRLGYALREQSLDVVLDQLLPVAARSEYCAN